MAYQTPQVLPSALRFSCSITVCVLMGLQGEPFENDKDMKLYLVQRLEYCIQIFWFLPFVALNNWRNLQLSSHIQTNNIPQEV